MLLHRDHGEVRVSFGELTVTSQVVAYQRRAPDGTVLETVPLDLPEQTLRTRGVWYDIDQAALLRAGLTPVRIPGALHAAEHAAIGLLPLFAICDRWDIGGMSTALHPHTGCPTVFVHDGHPGGAGFAERGHAVLAELAGRDPGGDRGLRVPHRLPVLRAVAQVRQRQRPAGQGAARCSCWTWCWRRCAARSAGDPRDRPPPASPVGGWTGRRRPRRGGAGSWGGASGTRRPNRSSGERAFGSADLAVRDRNQ